MKNNILNFAVAASIAASAMIAGSVARAEDLPGTKARQQFSVTQGLGRSSLPVLQRASASDQNAVSAGLIGKLRPASVYQTATLGGKLRTTGEQWSLEVSSDASGAEYHDLAVAALAHSLGRPLSQKIAAAELEQKGRAFIASNLASQIVLGQGEQLVALRADYRTEGGQDLTTGVNTSAVVANRIVFGRILGGVPVVGNGSKVILTFTNDGSLESFRYDWPAYQAGDALQVVSAGEVLSRVQQVMGVRANAAPMSMAPVPGIAGKEYPVEVAPNVQLEALDCGYYDSGSTDGKLKSIQPGCTYLTVSQDANGMRVGHAGAVPAGVSFAVDAGWMETQILSAKQAQ
jgi:hypothetical protein